MFPENRKSLRIAISKEFFAVSSNLCWTIKFLLWWDGVSSSSLSLIFVAAHPQCLWLFSALQISSNLWSSLSSSYHKTSGNFIGGFTVYERSTNKTRFWRIKEAHFAARLSLQNNWKSEVGECWWTSVFLPQILLAKLSPFYKELIHGEHVIKFPFTRFSSLSCGYLQQRI